LIFALFSTCFYEDLYFAILKLIRLTIVKLADGIARQLEGIAVAKAGTRGVIRLKWIISGSITTDIWNERPALQELQRTGYQP